MCFQGTSSSICEIRKTIYKYTHILDHLDDLTLTYYFHLTLVSKFAFVFKILPVITSPFKMTTVNMNMLMSMSIVI